MSWILAVIGTALLLLVLADLVKTTITLRGAGPLTSRAASWGWHLIRRMDRQAQSKRLMTYGGAVISLLTVTGWIVVEWIAWTLIFSAGAPSIVESQSGSAANLWGTIYYTGYALFTLGLGDYRPSGPLWQILTNLVSATGFLTISLSAAYLIPMLSAAAAKRQVAIHISGLGKTPSEILITCWNGSDFSNLAQHLLSLTPTIIQVGQQHLAYPVVHYYYSESPDASLPVRIAALDEALALLEHGVHEDKRLPRAIVAPALDGIRAYLDSLRRLHLNPAEHVPAVPSLEPLRQAGIPVVGEAEFLEGMRSRLERRRVALAMIEESGWHWKHVVPQAETALQPSAQRGPLRNLACELGDGIKLSTHATTGGKGQQ